jgi:hypothetical protein
MDLKATGCEVVAWIQVPQDRVQWQAVMNILMNLQVPKGWNILIR